VRGLPKPPRIRLQAFDDCLRGFENRLVAALPQRLLHQVKEGRFGWPKAATR
jgi:hypothetical protein